MNWVQHTAFNVLIAGLLFLHGCTGKDAPECVSALGEIVTESRELNAFHRIVISGRLNVNMIQDSINKAEVLFGQGLTDGIITKVSDGTLRISEENSCDWIRDQSVNPTIDVHYSNIDEIINRSSANVTFENEHNTGKLSIEVDDVAGSVFLRFNGDSLKVIAHTGATDFTIEGKSHFAYFYNSTYAPLNAQNLTSEIAIPHNNLTGDIIVNATERVSYQIFDSGDIIAFGNPKVVQAWVQEGNGEFILK